MYITAIKQQERAKGRYSVYVDERYAFSLSADALLEQKLYQGQQVDQRQLEAFKKLSVDDKAYGLAVAYVTRRLRSHWELTDYVRRKGYDEALSKQILQRLEQFRLIDDTKFARAWVNDRRLFKATSKRRLTQELRAKRIADPIIQEVLAEDETDELQVLRALVERKRKQTRYQDNTKLMQYLARQGFSYEAIKQVLSDNA